MHPKNISISDYSYDLPEEKIARYPLAERDASKLLIYREGNISEDVYRNIDSHLPSESLLIFNNTKVVEARILFQKPTGGVIEIFCLEPHEQYRDITQAMLQHGMVLWKCLVGGASKWKRGQVLEKKIIIKNDAITLRAYYREKRSDHFIIELNWSPERLSFAELLHHAGVIPLPPYLKREAENSDRERYQTIYANYNGSVAAPTAGLHFTPQIFERLKQKEIHTSFVTLHVGAGTFKPVKAETMGAHEMHAEFIEVSEETIRNILSNLDCAIISVGTTSLRTLESLYWLGLKTIRSPEADDLYLAQWEPYELSHKDITPHEALTALLTWMTIKKVRKLITQTQIIIAPGYEPKIIKGLITNFHQPNSTLLLLVAALLSDSSSSNQWREVYQYALTHNYRFLSYGDGSLLWLPGRKDN